VTAEGKIKTNPIAILDRRQVPRSAGEYDIAIPQWLIQWDNLPVEQASWEDAAFIQSAFPSFKP
jgi:hypothetical protein